MRAVKSTWARSDTRPFPLNEFEPLLALSPPGTYALLADGGRGAISAAGVHPLADFYVGLSATVWAPAMSNTQTSNVWTEFGRGYFTFYVSGPWNIAEFGSAFRRTATRSG